MYVTSELDVFEPSNIATCSLISSIWLFASAKCSAGNLPDITFVYFVSCKYAKSISKDFNWVATFKESLYFVSSVPISFIRDSIGLRTASTLLIISSALSANSSEGISSTSFELIFLGLINPLTTSTILCDCSADFNVSRILLHFIDNDAILLATGSCFDTSKPE